MFFLNVFLFYTSSASPLAYLDTSTFKLEISLVWCLVLYLDFFLKDIASGQSNLDLSSSSTPYRTFHNQPGTAPGQRHRPLPHHQHRDSRGQATHGQTVFGGCTLRDGEFFVGPANDGDIPLEVGPADNVCGFPVIARRRRRQLVSWIALVPVTIRLNRFVCSSSVPPAGRQL